MEDFIIENGVFKKYTGKGGSVSIPDGVTEIGFSAFWHRCDLTEITIPEGVSIIGDGAFEGCSQLKALSLPESLGSIGAYAFRDCDGIQRITCKAANLTIGAGAFSECLGICEITAPEKAFAALWKAVPSERKFQMALQYLSAHALPAAVSAYCKRKEAALLREICQNDRVDALDALMGLHQTHALDLFEQYLDAARGHAQVTAYLLERRSRLFSERDVEQRAEDLIEKELGLRERSTADWKEMFSFSVSDGGVCISAYRKNEEALVVPDEIDGMPVTEIADKAFQKNDSLRRIVLPRGLTRIGHGAFRECTALERAEIPETVTAIGFGAFSGCAMLSELRIPDGLTLLGAEAFRGCARLTELHLPQGVRAVGAYVFDGCASLASVTLPDGMDAVAEYLFRDCKKLTAVCIPDSVRKINVGAFTNCKSFKEITLPENVKEIEDYAFRGCTGLTKITIPPATKIIRPNAFSGCKKLTISAASGTRGANFAKANKIPCVSE